MDSSPSFAQRNHADETGLDYLKDDSQRSAITTQKPKSFPDPAQFPDPYPSRLPTLYSSGGSSSNSTRSSAYKSSGSHMASGDYNHVHIATGEEDSVAVGITHDAVVQQLLAKDSSHARPFTRPPPPEQSRWSGAYSARSRSSSIGNNSASNDSPIPAVPALHQKPSYDISWHPVDERDEIGMTDEETDDDHGIEDGDSSFPCEAEDDERTAAAVVAEEGRALIVHAENTPVIQLQVQPGTTHLLLGSSTTPNAVPQFLTNTLPSISTTLLALDISANFLGALPPALAGCVTLEELNVGSNPLRVLPDFLRELINLRVLIADSTGIGTLPEDLVELDKLHTLSIRRNKLNALPSWLCLLPALQTLCVDGNPFQGPWKALVDPLLAKAPMTPSYPPSTPMFPLSASLSGSMPGDQDTDNEDNSDHDSSSLGRSSGDRQRLIEEEDHTITPGAPQLARSATAPAPFASPPPPLPHPLQRTRTTPNRAYHEQSRGGNQAPIPESPAGIEAHEEAGPSSELRKMKSAGDLRRGRSNLGIQDQPAGLAPLSKYSTSASSSNLLSKSESIPPALPQDAKRFASLGASTMMGPSRPPGNSARPQLSKSMWDSSFDTSSDPAATNASYRNSHASSSTIVNRSSTPVATEPKAGSSSSRRPSRDAKEKSRWGFLKKMSMGKIKPDNTSPSSSPGPPSRTITRPPLPTTQSSPVAHARPSMADRKTPQIDVRFSTTGMLDMPSLNAPSDSPPQLQKKSSTNFIKQPSLLAPTAPPSNNFLSANGPTPRGAKRRSFLPFDQPGTLSIPESSAFVPNVTPTNEADETEPRIPTPSPTTPVIDTDQHQRREEERAREAYVRALRSVMAYLKDMNDLAQHQQPNPLSVYGDDALNAAARSRRPTVVERSRENSMVSSNGSSSDASNHLRSMESIAALRSGTSSQTLSVATTDSTSSMDERKYKDDKGKRAKIIQEIVSTERTYVKGLQELVDIYIKPAAVPVNLLSGVGSKQETVVPAPERRVVFGGVDALFSFHNESFLPALEKAAAPLHKLKNNEDADGNISLDVARAVGDIFVKHAAFMRMYSSYINNFDNALQSVAAWSSSTGTTSPASATSPSSSTAQLVGLTLSMSGAPVPPPETASGPSISSSQKKRIKKYLQRCRMNPRHTQLNLEGYLLLPVQRIPRYKLLLEELLRSTPPAFAFMDDPLDRALAEISSLANNMNEGKREAESRRRLVGWQSRIRGRFPSPLVQPHRRLIMDGALKLTRVVRKAVVSFEAINAHGDASTVQVDCLAPELTPRPLVGILCNDLLVLCRDPSEGRDPNGPVDLWAVLRMQTVAQPASIVHGNALRLVDNKAILYFDAPTPSDALNWYRAINLHIPASKA